VSAVASVTIKRWGAGVHPLSLAAVPMLLCAILVAPVAAIAERGARVVFDARSLAALVYLAVLGSALTFTVFYWLLARVPATRVALISYLIPIVAVVIGAVAFDEPLRPRLLAGSALVLAGVGLVSALRLRRAPPAGPTAERPAPRAAESR
jgi:drug/metabolite transporter (DMT)-like permease